MMEHAATDAEKIKAMDKMAQRIRRHVDSFETGLPDVAIELGIMPMNAEEVSRG